MERELSCFVSDSLTLFFCARRAEKIAVRDVENVGRYIDYCDLWPTKLLDSSTCANERQFHFIEMEMEKRRDVIASGQHVVWR